MQITRKSMLTGKSHTMEIPISEKQLEEWMKGETMIQDAFPNLSAGEREFLLTGIHPDEWKETFNGMEEE